MMSIAKSPHLPNIDALASMFANCPDAVQAVKETLGDNGDLIDFWFDFAFGSKHAVFFRYRTDTVRTGFALLEKQ
jgi:hypothetical protein